MVIKKYTFEKNNKETTESRLLQYKAQAKGFLRVNKKRKQLLNLDRMKSGLAMVLPLAAASLTPFVGIGQSCDGSGSYSGGGSCNSGDFQLDIDGGGADFVFISSAAGLYMRRVNGPAITTANDFVAYGFHYAKGYAVGATIDENSGNFTAGGNPTGGVACGLSTAASWVLETSYGGGNGAWFNSGGAIVTKVAGVVKNGFVGFIEIIWNNANSTVSFGEYGLAAGVDLDIIEGGTCSSLPVELVRFFGKKENNNFILGWQTASEINNAGFEVQRSTDGEIFRKLAWIDGVGNSLVLNDYSYEDTELEPNQRYYYRLKQIDLDGKFEYSNQLTYMNLVEGVTTVKDFAPNPITVDFAELRIISPKRQGAQVMVYDAMGKSLFENKTTLIKGMHTIRLDLGNAQSGTHFVKVVLENGESYFKKLIVTK